MAKHVNAFTASFSIHLLLVAALIWLSPAAVRESSRAVAATASPGAVLAPVLELPRSRDPEKSRSATSASAKLDIPNDTGSTEVRMPNFSFDFGKVKRRAASLFPFVTHDFVFEPIRVLATRTEPTGLVNPHAVTGTDDSGRPPLAMSDAAVAVLVDKTWSRRERWNGFQGIADLAKRHSPTRGKLPAVLRRYADQNLLQPYVESHARDPRLWVMLGIASDHSDFIDFITRYVAEHPATPAATELLFMLDQIAQGSRDSLLTLLDIDPQKDLWWTRHQNEDAHGLVLVLQKYYRTKLEQKGIGSSEGTSLYFDNVRLEILTAVVRSTPGGYRASDARFLVGAIYWRNGLPDEAVRWWRDMTPAATDRYAISAGAILNAVAGRSAAAVDRQQIDDILQAERRRWTDFWWTRLRQFGHAFGSF